jgi:uncharacterized protein with PIN domain
MTQNVAASAPPILSNSQWWSRGRSVPRQAASATYSSGELKIVIEPVTVEQTHLARQAFLDFGKGRHPANLNFGDCFAYALAKATGEPLLFKGEDFSKTDVRAAVTA